MKIPRGWTSSYCLFAFMILHDLEKEDFLSDNYLWQLCSREELTDFLKQIQKLFKVVLTFYLHRIFSSTCPARTGW